MIIDQRYKEVKAGVITKEDFLAEARRDSITSKFITGFTTFEEAINLFKSKGYIFEETTTPVKKFSVTAWMKESIDDEINEPKGTVHSEHVNAFEYEKGWRYEIKAIGKYESEDIQKAKAKAVKNLEKDELHYTKLEMDGKYPDPKGTEMLDVSKGKNYDTPDNQSKPVKGKAGEATDTQKYVDDMYDRAKQPLKKKSSLNEGLSLAPKITKEIEKVKNWLATKTAVDKNKPKYKEAIGKLTTELDKDASEVVKALKANIESASPDFPNQASGEDFKARLNDIYTVYASLDKANLLDYTDEDYLPAEIANPIIEALRTYVATLRDHELADSYKYLKEDTSTAVGNFGMENILQKITGVNLGAHQPISNLKDAITKVGGGNYDQGLTNVKALFKGNGAGNPDTQVDLLKKLIDQGSKSGAKLADVFNKAKETFGSGKEGQKLFSIAGTDKSLISTSVKTMAKAAGNATDTAASHIDTVAKAAADHSTHGGIKAAAKAAHDVVTSDHTLQNITHNILTPIGITLAIGAVLFGAAELKKQTTSRYADLKRLYSKLEPLEDDTNVVDKDDAELAKMHAKDAEKEPAKETPKEEVPASAEVPKGPEQKSEPVELSPELPKKKSGKKEPAAKTEPAAKPKEEPKAKEPKAKAAAKEPEVAAASKEEPKVSKIKEPKVKPEEPKEVPSAPKGEKLKAAATKVKAILYDPEYYKNKPGVKVISFIPSSDKGNKKYQAVKFGVSDDVQKLYMEGEPAQKKHLRSLFALIAAKVKSDKKAINVDLSTQDLKTIEKVAKGKIKIATPEELKEGIIAVLESSALDDLTKSHQNDKNPLVQSEHEDPENKVPGGKGDKLSAADVDQEELAMGLTIEAEHTNDPEIAKEIALDHLAEDPKYYTHMKEAGLAEAVQRIPAKVEYPFYAIQYGNKFVAGFSREEDARAWTTNQENRNKQLKVYTRDEVSKMKNMSLKDPKNWNNIGTNNFMWKEFNEQVDQLKEAIRKVVKAKLLKEFLYIPDKEGPDVDRKELKRQLQDVTWPAVGEPDNKEAKYADPIYRSATNKERVDAIRKLIDRMGQEGIDLYNEYAPEGCKWGEENDLFSVKEETEEVVPQIRQDIKDLEDLDPKDLAKMVLNKEFDPASVKNKAAAIILGKAIQAGEKDADVKKAFMQLADQLKKK